MQKLFNICSSQIIKHIWPTKPFVVDNAYKILKSRKILVVESFRKFSECSRPHYCLKIVMGEHLIPSRFELIE